MRIFIINQLFFFLSVPALYLLFPGNSCLRIVCLLIINQFFHVILGCETGFVHMIFVFIHPSYQIIGNTGIQHPIDTVCQNIYIKQDPVKPFYLSTSLRSAAHTGVAIPQTFRKPHGIPTVASRPRNDVWF